MKKALKIGLDIARQKIMLTETSISTMDLVRILENMNTAVLLLDSQLHISYINPASEMLFEISLRKATGLHCNQLILDPDSFSDRLNECLQTYHPFSERGLEIQVPLVRNITVDCTVTPLFEPQQENALLIEMIPMDRHLRISKEENLIAQTHATQGLIRGLAHEIKNPLGGLRGAAQLLERELPEQELKEYTQIIIGEADRLQNLVNRMLGPNSLPNKSMINIHNITERVRSLVEVEAPDMVKITTDYDPSIPELKADPDQLIQVVMNLLRNAVQAVGETGTIIIRSRTSRQFTIGNTHHKLVLKLEIIDDGPGIPDDMLEEIFYPMITGHADGTGLGLTIAQSLINRHDGLIECKSKPGKTVFRILLPLENGNNE